MTTSTLVPLEEYLHTTYQPDCEWVNGELRERHLGNRPHAMLQKFFFKLFLGLEGDLGMLVYAELRAQVSSTNFRIPDLMLVRKSDPYELMVTRPPFLCVEVLSPDDSLSNMQDKIEDYLRMGVPHIWVVDPTRRKAYVVEAGRMLSVPEFTVPTTSVRITLDDMFADLDQFEGLD